ncbi:MAG: NADH-quinone oxidoreductase subunit N [Proteobacteria bacterium]|nr:NADH-quinone oxidoreductase subunit N [Desulfobulbaceae bacterium]MBU4151645.1 NADH-quinone oxidoreductase subunit N [Pseudomonadota bacterium]
MTLLLPDFLLLLLAAIVMTVDLIRLQPLSTASFHLSWTGLLAIFLVLTTLPYNQEIMYLGTYKVTGTSLLFKQVFVLSALCTVLLSASYFAPRGNARGTLKYRSEFYCIIMLCTFGMFAVVSATDLLTLFIGMELATIPLYILSGYQKEDSLSVEASTKYIIMGSLSTGFLLFGYSFLYGCAGSLSFEALLAFTQSFPSDPLLRLGVLFVLAAIGFKLTVFPFHMWAPDVYEGSPTPVTAFISVSSKAVAIAFLLILVYGPLAPLHDYLQPILLLLAGATMTIGNLGAMKQARLRRFMAYSSIAQAGYILMAMAGKAETARSSIIYYLFVYAAANYAIFFIISIVGRDRSEDFRSLQGMGKKNPALAAVLMLTIFSLSGIPPLAGFMGKFLLFASAAKQGFYGMVIFAALNSTVSLYYYLLLVKEAYIIQPAASSKPLVIDNVQRTTLALLTVTMIILGLIPMFSTSILAVVQ